MSEAMEILEAITKAQQGDSVAFAEIYDCFADRIFKFIRFRVQNREQAEDLLQETFLKAWRGMPSLRLEDLNFSAWLYKVASNTVNDHLRKIYRTPETLELFDELEIASSDSPEKSLMIESEIAAVRKAMQNLMPQYSEILELRFVRDFSLEETAKILGKSNLAVRLLQHRALKQLRTILGNNDNYGFIKIQ